MVESSGEWRIDHLRVFWNVDESRPDCDASVWWQQSLIVSEVLDQGNPIVPFAERVNGGLVKGELTFRVIEPKSELLLDMVYPGGEVKNLRLWPIEP